jgi:hypothetical protein
MPIERVGFDQVWQRTLFVLDAATPADIPQHFSLSSEYFVCLLAWDARTASADEISAVAGSLLDGGAVYVVAWGADCGRVHDIIDENRNEVDGPVVMTTWHEGEELRDAIRFVLAAAVPDDGFQAHCRSTLGIAIGSPGTVAQIRRAFANPADFVHKQDASG